MKLSAVLICKNENSCIDSCLNSVKDCDEIIVCDTGSDDNTIEIARRYTDKIFTDFKWCDDFSKARNHALSKATGEWIISIDCDETLEEGGVEKIRKEIEKATTKTINIILVDGGNGSEHFYPRVFKRCPEVKWCGAIHNYLSVSEDYNADIRITYQYSEAHQKDPDRAFRILSKEVNSNPKVCREKFYLAREYWYRQDYKNAVFWYDEYLKVAWWAPEMAEAWLVKARCLEHLNRFDDAKNACLMAIKINANFKEAILYMASLSGPGNKKRWLEFAKTATNQSILFVRTEEETKYEIPWLSERYDLRVYYNEGMKFFGERTGIKRYNPKTDADKPLFFVGLYFDKDYEVFKNHKGLKIVLFNGSDVQRLLERPDWIKLMQETDAILYCQSQMMVNELGSVGIYSQLKETFFGDPSKYPKCYKPSKNPKAYITAHAGREEEYGINMLVEVAKEFPNIQFHIYGVKGINQTNVIYHGEVSEEIIDNDSKNFQVCLRLNKHDGYPQGVAKANLMGIPVIQTSDKQTLINKLRLVNQ